MHESQPSNTPAWPYLKVFLSLPKEQLSIDCPIPPSELCPEQKALPQAWENAVPQVLSASVVCHLIVTYFKAIWNHSLVLPVNVVSSSFWRICIWRKTCWLRGRKKKSPQCLDPPLYGHDMHSSTTVLPPPGTTSTFLTITLSTFPKKLLNEDLFEGSCFSLIHFLYLLQFY